MKPNPAAMPPSNTSAAAVVVAVAFPGASCSFFERGSFGRIAAAIFSASINALKLEWELKFELEFDLELSFRAKPPVLRIGARNLLFPCSPWAGIRGKFLFTMEDGFQCSLA